MLLTDISSENSALVGGVTPGACLRCKVGKALAVAERPRKNNSTVNSMVSVTRKGICERLERWCRLAVPEGSPKSGRRHFYILVDLT